MSDITSLSQPWYLEPQYYALMVYPAEWMVESDVNDHVLRSHSNAYYSRNWGRAKVMSLYTLFYKQELAPYMGEDVLTGYVDALRKDSELSLFPSEGLSLFQAGKLKELAKEHRRDVAGYVATPLIPSPVEPFIVYKINLGIPQSAESALLEIKSQEKIHYGGKG